MTIWRMRIPHWITTATNTHLEYVILIAFPLKQLLQECASVLRTTYIGLCIFCRSVSYSLYFLVMSRPDRN